MDIMFQILDYDEPEIGYRPQCPDDEIPKCEKERLFEELCALIDAGAFDPANEIFPE
jgi:hypothetical protein